MIATHEEPEAHALETSAASPAMKRENSDHDGASPAIPIPKRRRTSDKSGPRSTAGRTTKGMGGASEDDINSLFWLVEVREPRLASRAPRSPARGNWIRRVQRVFFSSRKDTRGERSLEARSGRMGGVLPLLGPVAPPPPSSSRQGNHPCRDENAAGAPTSEFHAAPRRPPRRPRHVFFSFVTTLDVVTEV